MNLGEHLGDWSLDDEHQVSSSKKYEKDNGAFKVIAKPQNSETEGEAIANGHYKVEYTDSYKFSQEGKNSEIISELSKQAKELSKADPDNNYIVTVSREEGINIIAIPKSKSWGENLSNDIVKAKDAVVKYHKKSKEDWKNKKYLSSVGNAIVSRINLLNLIQTGIGTTISQQLYEFNPGEVQYGKVEDVLKRRTDSETNAKGIIDTAVGSIASTTIPNKIGGGRITLPETAQAVVATGEAVGVGGKVITLPVIGTGGAKAMLIVNAIGNGSKDSEKVREPSNKNQEEKVVKDKNDSKESINSNYETKKGNKKVEKYLEKGETLEEHYKKYAIENVKNEGINVGRTQEHSNKTLGHWEKMVDTAKEAKKNPDVKNVYLDESLNKISPEKFGDSKLRPDIVIEYKDKKFKFIEVESTTDTSRDLIKKLEGLQIKYGKDVIQKFEVLEPKGGK